MTDERKAVENLKALGTSANRATIDLLDVFDKLRTARRFLSAIADDPVDKENAARARTCLEEIGRE